MGTRHDVSCKPGIAPVFPLFFAHYFAFRDSKYQRGVASFEYWLLTGYLVLDG